MISFLIIPSEASISFFLFKVTYRYHFYQVTYPVLRDRCWFGYRLQVGALFTTVPSIRVSRVGRVRVTLTVTIRVSIGLALWLVSGIALNKGIPVNGGPKFL